MSNTNSQNKKEFDCVEMKRKGQERILEMVKGLTAEEELAFWKKKDQELLACKEASHHKQKIA